MTKVRVNWTLEKDVTNLLRQASKLSGGKSSSQLVEFAVRNTFKNKVEYLRDKRKELQREIMSLTDQIDALEKTKEDKGDDDD